MTPNDEPHGYATYNVRVRYLGVDPGGRRLGLAVADSETGVASPLTVLPYGGLHAAARQVVSAAENTTAEVVVIGLPTRDDGSEAPGARRSQLLAEAIRSFELEVVLHSELLTTREARERARTAGRRPEDPVDDIAAQVILEDYLQTLSRSEIP
jgi:putative Holliday junction resolvase